MQPYGIDIVIPVLNDIRILDTIKSIRHFDDIDGVRVVVMAGKSSEGFLASVQAVLYPGDDLCTEPDNGIFDALNKGLDRCTAPIIGWLGGDDVFTGHVTASDVVAEFEAHAPGILVYSTQYHVGGQITRELRAGLSKPSFVRWGFHNGHFSTFLGRAVYEKNRFPIRLERRNLFSDIEYFAELLMSEKVVTNDEVCTYMAEGGSASGTLKSVWVNFSQRYHLFRQKFGIVSGICAPMICLAWKIVSVLRYKISPRRCQRAWDNQASNA